MFFEPLQTEIDVFRATLKAEVALHPSETLV